MHVTIVTPARCTSLIIATLRPMFNYQMEGQRTNSTEDSGVMRQKTKQNTGPTVNYSRLLMKASSGAAVHINIDILPTASKGPSASQEIVVLMVQ